MSLWFFRILNHHVCEFFGLIARIAIFRDVVLVTVMRNGRHKEDVVVASRFVFLVISKTLGSIVERSNRCFLLEEMVVVDRVDARSTVDFNVQCAIIILLDNNRVGVPVYRD